MNKRIITVQITATIEVTPKQYSNWKREWDEFVKEITYPKNVAQDMLLDNGKLVRISADVIADDIKKY